MQVYAKQCNYKCRASRQKQHCIRNRRDGKEKEKEIRKVGFQAQKIAMHKRALQGYAKQCNYSSFYASKARRMSNDGKY